MTVGRRQPFIRHRIIEGIGPWTKPSPVGYFAVSGCLRSLSAKTAEHAGWVGPLEGAVASCPLETWKWDGDSPVHGACLIYSN